MGDLEFLIETAFQTFRVHVDRFASEVPSEAQRESARRLALELRFALGFGSPSAIDAAQRLRHALVGVGPFDPRRIDASLQTRRFLDGLGEFLEEAFDSGRLLVLPEPAIANVPEQELTVRRPRLDAQPPELLTPRNEGPLETAFEARFVDEIGQAISGLKVKIEAGDRAESVITNAAGVALLEGATAGVGTVAIVDVEGLEKILQPRWSRQRSGKAPGGRNTSTQAFSDEPGIADLKGGVPNTIVITPILGTIFLELWDKAQRVVHAQRDYTITGPASFSGTTDEKGRLRHELVPNGEYTLSLTLEFFEGDPDAVTETVESPVVVAANGDSGPQVRAIGAVPRSIVAQLHLFFNTNKTFLLPTAFPSLQKLRDLYADNAPCELLVVGHADTRGTSAYNDKLSLERAKSTIAFLKDDVDSWLAFYGSDVERQKRWGKVEDRLMITAMPDFISKGKNEDAVHWYQRTRGLTVDGSAGTETRTALITEYMSLDGASLSDTLGEVVATAHGAGENFPLDDSGEELDAAPADEKRDPGDRRVELFFFDAEFGITPPPPGENSGPGSTEYPTWRKRVAEVVELRAGELDGPKVVFAELIDAHFRTDSCVVLPEGEDPDDKTHQSLSSVGVIATALRFNEEHAGRSMLVAGHTDTRADPKFNQTLSEERARVALALLKGGDPSREDFKKLCDGRHTVADIKQILSWVARAFDAPIQFNCDPGKIDNNLASATKAITAFQTDFNRNKQALGSSAADLTPDGSVGPLTWGAFFDCYEFALQQELGETPAGLATLRGQLTFVDPAHESLGFSEFFPIEELGVDEFRSQANRRVEFLFFEQGEEPDVAHAADDPETSDLYLPGFYQRESLPPMLSAKPWQATFDVPNASLHQSRQLLVNAPDLPAGVPLKFEVHVVGAGLVAQLDGLSTQGSAAQSFEDWDAPVDAPFVGDLSAGQPFPPVFFEFTVEGGGRLVKSKAPLAYADTINMQLVVNVNGTNQVLANQPYVVNTAWGRRSGTTDAQGLVLENGLPPGGVSVALRDRFLVGNDSLPFGWDRDAS